MGISAIAAWLNQHGYKKKKRQNNTLDAFASSFIKGVLDNPVYCGKLAYGRRKNEKVSGTRNEYRIVKQENYMLHDGIHEGIISETDWELAHQKREKTGVKYEKTHSLNHEHILSGILRCPLCGSGMYGNVNRKKKKDGTLYKDYFYYACKHRRLVDGHKCGYRKQWSEEKINNAVEEVIRKLVKNPKFEEAILNKIGSRIDTEEIEKEIEGLEKQHRQLTGAKARLGQQMDSLDIMDKFYEKKYQDMETRLYRLYDEIEGVENSIEEVKNRLLNIRQQRISEENVYQFLLYFDKLYDKFTDLEKKEFLNSFVEQVDIYEQEQPDGRFLKHVKFRFPVYFGDRETQELCWDNESTVETVCLLSKLHANQHIEVELQMDELDLTAAESKATYEEIKEYVLKQSGLKVSNLYIAQVKQKCGIIERENYNLPKSENSRQPKCPPEKEAAIREALEHFRMI